MLCFNLIPPPHLFKEISAWYSHFTIPFKLGSFLYFSLIHQMPYGNLRFGMKSNVHRIQNVECLLWHHEEQSWPLSALTVWRAWVWSVGRRCPPHCNWSACGRLAFRGTCQRECGWLGCRTERKAYAVAPGSGSSARQGRAHVVTRSSTRPKSHAHLWGHVSNYVTGAQQDVQGAP